MFINWIVALQQYMPILHKQYRRKKKIDIKNLLAYLHLSYEKYYRLKR